MLKFINDGANAGLFMFVSSAPCEAGEREGEAEANPQIGNMPEIDIEC